MKLSGPQVHQFATALQNAFDEASLTMLVHFVFPQPSEILTPGASLPEMVFRTITAAEATGRTTQLLAAARNLNPGDPDLIAVAQPLGLAPVAPPRAVLEKMVLPTSKFHDVPAWSRQMGEMMPRVCRIEIPGMDQGTGFLVAPGVVMTAYHVIEAVVSTCDGKDDIDPARVRLLFDYQRTGDGTEVNEGVLYRLVADGGLIDRSPYHPSEKDNDGPLEDAESEQLDYALLRVDGEPGYDPVGGQVGSGAPNRGWISIPATTYHFQPGSLLHILQHPMGRPLARASGAIVDRNPPGTRIMHNASTERGSSGSPCFNGSWELVALHHGAAGASNRGIPIDKIRGLLEQRGFWSELQAQPPLPIIPAPPVAPQRPAPEPPSSVAAPDQVAVWNEVPRRNHHFIGREEEFATLEKTLQGSAGRGSPPVVAVHGLDGIGKTVFAVEHAYRQKADYGIVWWLRAGDASTLAGDFSALARVLGLPEGGIDDSVANVRAFLERTDRRWLLLFDDADDVEAVRAYLPRTGVGHVLVTSRNPNWAEVAAEIELEVLTEAEAMDFLLRRGNGEAQNPEEVAAARQLAAELGRLPIALEYAAAAVERSGYSLAEYLEKFPQDRDRMLAFAGERTSPLAATWSLAFTEVKSESPSAAALLNLIAFLAPDAIPLDLLMAQARYAPKPLAAALADEVTMDETVAVLLRHSLVDRSGEKALVMHRLVHDAARERLSKQRKRTWAGAAVRMLDEGFLCKPWTEPTTWPLRERLLPHARMAARHAEALGVELDAAGTLFNSLGRYFTERSQLDEAREMFERAVAMDEKAHGPDSPETATALANLGSMLYRLGDYAAAREKVERALALHEKALDEQLPGANPLNVAQDLNHLGNLLAEEGDPKGAQEQYERAVAISEASGGPDDPNLVTWLGNLGVVLKEQGDLVGAQKRYERALVIAKKAFGAGHPSVAGLLRKLGQLLREDDKTRSKELLEEALAINEQTQGPGHHDVMNDLHELAYTLRAQGDLVVAKEHFTRALQIAEKLYGADHVETADRLTHLASLVREQGDPTAARNHYERALAIWRAHEKSGRMAATLQDIAAIDQQAGDVADAVTRLREAILLLQQSSPSYEEGNSFWRLGDLAIAAGRQEDGLRLRAVCYVIDRQLGHSDAEAVDLPEIKKLATEVGYEKTRLTELLATVEAAYQQDRGQGIVAAAFDANR